METPKKSEWKKTSVQCLYERRPEGLPATKRGTFYFRFSVNGTPTFRSLETSVFEHAKIKHARRMANVQKDRQRGPDLGTEFKTPGALFDEGERRMKGSVSPKTRRLVPGSNGG